MKYLNDLHSALIKISNICAVATAAMPHTDSFQICAFCRFLYQYYQYYKYYCCSNDSKGVPA